MNPADVGCRCASVCKKKKCSPAGFLFSFFFSLLDKQGEPNDASHKMLFQFFFFLSFFLKLGQVLPNEQMADDNIKGS